MTKETSKTKNIPMKLNVPSNADLDTFLKNQQNVVSRLKTELKSVITQVQQSDNGTVEKDKCLRELEQSINKREAEIFKLTASLEQLKEENSRVLMEFNFFKEKFYQLETDYDKTLNLQQRENENLRLQLQQQQSHENHEIHQLSLKCQDLQQALKDSVNDLTHLNKLHVETLQHLDQIKTNYEREQKEFELYKQQVSEEKRLAEEKHQLDFSNLKDELKQKDETLNQCISDKNALEKAKNLTIDELNNKICRIERAFGQPTKVVQPMVILPEPANNSDVSNAESSIENVAISFPQVRKPLENLSAQTLLNNENKTTEQTQTQRNYKFKRPIQPPTSSQQSNVQASNVSQRKRRNQPLRQISAKKIYNEFSLSSSDEDNYSTFSQQLWRPNNKDCYVPDTDTSEGFNKPKRSKN